MSSHAAAEPVAGTESAAKVRILEAAYRHIQQGGVRASMAEIAQAAVEPIPEGNERICGDVSSFNPID